MTMATQTRWSIREESATMRQISSVQLTLFWWRVEGHSKVRRIDGTHSEVAKKTKKLMVDWAKISKKQITRWYLQSLSKYANMTPSQSST